MSFELHPPHICHIFPHTMSSLRIETKLYFRFQPYTFKVSLVAQAVKSLPAILETQVRSLGQEDPLEKEMVTHSSILAWKKSHRWSSLWGYSPWGHKESDLRNFTHLNANNCLVLNWIYESICKHYGMNYKAVHVKKWSLSICHIWIEWFLHHPQDVILSIC